MVNITLRLSESLLSILKDINNPREERYSIQVERGTTIKEILVKDGISPLLAPLVTIDNIRVDIDIPMEMDNTITLYGPMAGG